MEPSRAEFGSDYIVEILGKLGVSHLAFNPGATFRGLQDSLVNFSAGKEIELVQCCHEEIAVAVAHGFAKAKGRPMAVAVHDLVGLQHASMAIFNAWVDRVPIFILGGSGPTDAAKRRPWIEWIHSANVQASLVRDYVKLDDEPRSIEAVPQALMRAWRTMIAEPQGPVYVSLDADLQERRLPEPLIVPDVARFVRTTRLAPDPAAIDEAARSILAAERPLIVSGMRPRAETLSPLVELAELSGAAVVSSTSQLGFPTAHPQNLTGAGAELMRDADLVLALEPRRLRRMARPGCDVIAIGLEDISPRSWSYDYCELRSTKLDIVADPVLALPLLIEEVRRRRTPAHAQLIEQRRQSIALRHAAQREAWRSQAKEAASSAEISITHLVDVLGRKIEHLDWILSAMASTRWPFRLWRFDRAEQCPGPSGGAGVGYGIGASIGVALAHRGTDKLIVDIQPDGDLLYATSALWTLAHQKLPLLMIMHNNRCYQNSKGHAEEIARERGRPVDRADIGTAISDPAVDFASIARGFGIEARGPIIEPAQLGPALDWALEIVLKERRPVLVDVVAQSDWGDDPSPGHSVRSV